MENYPESTAVWHIDDDGKAVEPSESSDRFEEDSYTNWD